MDRRNFLQAMMYSSSLAATAGLGLTAPFRQAFALDIPNVSQRTLVNTMLIGGADLRYLIVPAPLQDPLYKAAFWQARKQLYLNSTENIAKYTSYEAVFSDLYVPVTFNGFTFGIHKNAGWLISQFQQGNVAIISNVVGSSNRRHDHSQLIMNTGDVNASQFIYDRDGWGGRFVNSTSASANVVAMSTDVSIFCNGLSPENRLQNVIHMKNSRDFALPGTNANPLSQQSILARSLKGYYERRNIKVEDDIAKGQLPADWPFRRFFQHEKSLRTFGDTFKARIDTLQANLPEAIQALKTSNTFNKKPYATQIGNLYDSIIAADILSLRCAYLEYGGWDTHRRQKILFERNINDIFGSTGGMNALTVSLDSVPGSNENLTYVFTSDFGRQLTANGDRGTDHGRGTYMIVAGRSVNGGVYGDMFPKREYQPDPTDKQVPPRAPFNIPGRDINGLTSYERVLSELCNWVEPNTGSQVFPNVNNTKLEANVDLTTLFKSSGVV